MTTTYQEVVLAEWLKEAIDFDALDYSNLIESIIADLFTPDEIFDTPVLEKWAEENGWVKDE